MKYTYLLIDLSSVIIPLLFSFHRNIRFMSKWKEYFLANIISAGCFICWDIIFTQKRIWGFNGKYLLGTRLFGLPVEEILFFFCIPFSCVFTYHCFNSFFKKTERKKINRRLMLLLAVFFFIIGIVFVKKAYTSSTFISTGILLFLCGVIVTPNWLVNLYKASAVLLIPFFIVNGILTGSGITEPIVWYNDTETMGVRIGTIPIEDIVYGFELILLTVFLFETLTTILKPTNRTQRKIQKPITNLVEGL